ncbi:MAG: DNA repair protein RadA [Candidatus Uhrbacteria bacterium]|nr:DNA repair protein RadA [Candidatus Uhrbacteria bacterium]
MFACTKCDAQFSKWAGRCTECGAWGTVIEDVGAIHESPSSRSSSTALPGKTQSFAALTSSESSTHRPTGLPVWDRILSGGCVPGSVTLLGGEPGIGKSTLLAQLGLTVSGQGKRVLYVTGEESPAQVALRLRRLSPTLPPTLEFLEENRADVIASTIENKKPDLTIIDSIQTVRLPDVSGEAGNASQLKACAATLTEAAKRSHAPIVLVGQVTKDGDLAGPKLVEHLVDTVLMMEGDRQQSFRILRVLKHRFGATDELAVLHMTERGLEEVLDPSAALVADRPKNVAGSIVTCLAQGSRPLLVEIQALVAPAGYGTPIRRGTGIDVNRLSLLLAVLGRRAGVSFGDQDVFVNVVGGIEAKEPATDLAICLALASAKQDIPIPPQTIAWGEVGLSGEIRPVSNSGARLKEATRLGFTTVIAPTGKIESPENIQLISCSTMREAIAALGKK